MKLQRDPDEEVSTLEAHEGRILRMRCWFGWVRPCATWEESRSGRAAALRSDVST